MVGALSLALVFTVLVGDGGTLIHHAQSTGATASSVLPAVLAPSTTTVTGTLTLVDDETASDYCVGEGGSSDIGPGSTMILTDESGKILGSSALGPSSEAASSTTCVYPFTVSDVAKDAVQHAVEVTHRVKVVHTRADLEASGWTFALSLG